MQACKVPSFLFRYTFLSSPLTASTHGSVCSHSSSLCETRRGIKNLHQYPHARYKRLVKDHIRFSRNWWLTAGNNYELVKDTGHEREAMENFGEYRDDSVNDTYLFSTNRLDDLPARNRLDAISGLLRKRWVVKDGNRGFDKAKLLLKALECFSEMRLSNVIPVFDALPEPDQDVFLQYAEGCSQLAQACSHSHPQAVAILIRAAEICDDMRCADKREELTRAAERCCEGMPRAYYFGRPSASRSTAATAGHDKAPHTAGKGAAWSSLLPPSYTEMETERRTREDLRLKEHFRDKPWVTQQKNNVLGTFITARNRTQLLHPMKEKDPRQLLLREPKRPEQDGLSKKGN